MNIPARKQALRQSIIAARSKIAEAEQQRASAAITQRITQLAGYRAAQKVLGYLNFGAEYAAELLVQQALRDGKQVWLPKVNRNDEHTGYLSRNGFAARCRARRLGYTRAAGRAL